MGNKWFKSEKTSKCCTTEELGDRTESKEDYFIQREYNVGQSGDDVLPGCSTDEEMAKKETLDKKEYQEQTIEFQEEIEYISHVKQKKDKKPYLHPLKVWHFLDSERESNITGATITRDRRVVFADHDNCSLKAYGLKVTNHFRIIRKRECRRSYVHLIKNINGQTRRYRPFDLCEYEENKVLVTTGEEKVLLFVDLKGKRIDKVKEVGHDYRGIIYNHPIINIREFITATFDVGGVCILDINGNIKQKINCPGILHEPVYISLRALDDSLILTDRQNHRITIIKLEFSSVSCINIKQEILKYSANDTVTESLKGIATLKCYRNDLMFVCDNRIKSVRRFELIAFKTIIELSPIKVGKEIQCIIYDDILNELYICPHRSNHALIWKRGGFVREVTVNEPIPLKFSSPVAFALEPELNSINTNYLDDISFGITDIVITLERELVLSDSRNSRLLVYDLKSEERASRNEDLYLWSEIKLEVQIPEETLLYQPKSLCLFDTNKLAVTTGEQRALLIVDIAQKKIDQTLNTVAEYSFILYHRNKFIVYQYFDNLLCFLNMKGEEVQRIILPDCVGVDSMSRLGDTLLLSDFNKDGVWSISSNHEKLYVLRPEKSKFSGPWGITPDDRGIVYVCERRTRSVRRLNFTTKEELPSIDYRCDVKYVFYEPVSEQLYLYCELGYDGFDLDRPRNFEPRMCESHTIFVWKVDSPGSSFLSQKGSCKKHTRSIK